MCTEGAIGSRIKMPFKLKKKGLRPEIPKDLILRAIEELLLANHSLINKQSPPQWSPETPEALQLQYLSLVT
uniref:SFRICE_020127 n=1 Tax=Spodoptera frugiperda TaxID=7108 RepID=A0A2H1V9U7_SPOFR